jgi:hypothetical protein
MYSNLYFVGLLSELFNARQFFSSRKKEICVSCNAQYVIVLLNAVCDNLWVILNSRNIYAANIMELHWYIPRVHETLLYSYSKFIVISWYTGIYWTES